MNERQKKLLDKIYNRPVEIGHALGFNDLTEMHNDWMQRMLFGEGDETLQAHRGSYKTTCVSIVLALIIELYPNCRTMFMRKTDGDVREVILQVKKIIESPLFQGISFELYGVTPKILTANGNQITTSLTTDIKGTVQLLGIGTNTSITGKHFDRIFTDDIVNVQDRISKAERDRIKVVYQELQNIKNRGGRIYNTGTPWHKEDCFTIMPSPIKYDCYNTNLISASQLEDIKSKMTPSLFCANYELKHIAGEDVIFMTPKSGEEQTHIMNGIAHVDSAFYGEDYTAFTIMAKHDGKYYVLGKIWRKHVEDCYTQIVNYYNTFLCQKLYNEVNADKGMVARDMRKLGIKVVKYHEKMNKYIKIVTYLKAIWKDVVFVEGTDDEYINQICDYTEDAEHDDAPDSCACLARLLYKKSESQKNYESLF